MTLTAMNDFEMSKEIVVIRHATTIVVIFVSVLTGILPFIHVAISISASTTGRQTQSVHIVSGIIIQ